MKEIVEKKLQQIEKEHGIKILYSCESGSRAWGFPSPDSDYDVRFIYTRQLEDYLTIQSKKDHLSFPINDELDIYGWDISKVLQLITKSNTTPFEWLQSPVIYKEDVTFKEELWQLSQNYFCPRSNIHHYLGVARGAMETMQEEEIKIKKLFYVLRPLLAALWCAERDTIAPMSIFPLMDLLSVDLCRKILSLIDLKSTAAEGYLIKIDEDLKSFIDITFDYCMEASTQMERKSFDIEEGDVFFRKTILK
jgi:predicted nucleotidyltransferase